MGDMKPMPCDAPCDSDWLATFLCNEIRDEKLGRGNPSEPPRVYLCHPLTTIHELCFHMTGQAKINGWRVFSPK